MSRHRATAIRQVALVVVAGLATGVLTQVGQSVLPDQASQAANAITPWLVVAFLVGSTMPDMPRAAVAGIGTLVLALVGYDAIDLDPSRIRACRWARRSSGGSGRSSEAPSSASPVVPGAQVRIASVPSPSACSSR